MKNIQSKSLLTLIIIPFIIGFSTSAKDIIGVNATNFSDFSTDSISNPTTNILNANYAHSVVYPVSLQEHRDESKNYVKKYSKNERSYIIYMFNRGKKYFPKMADIFEDYDVPQEMRMLPALESNFSANAVSNAGAVGYWQFMGQLAREYGLHTGGKSDERKNFVKSTVAAAKYFRDQLDFFNDDLLLTVASFNCGQGGVRSAIKKSNVSNPDFWDIKQYLPNETRIFVMKFIALNVISANYEQFLKGKMNFNTVPTVQLALTDTSGSDITSASAL
ncbi:MAG: lytic transglycosylase domain-containing protein [Ginsengibacter sp.]